MVLCCRNCDLEKIKKGDFKHTNIGHEVCRAFYTNGFCGLLHDIDKEEWKKRLQQKHKKTMELDHFIEDLQKIWDKQPKNEEEK